MALSSLKGLPTSLLLLLAAQLATAAQPQHPTAIRKMGFDAGEKFFPEYYAFSDEDAAPSQQHVIANSTAKPAIPARRGGILTEEEEALLAVNASASLPYRAPLAAHYYYSDSSSKRSVEARGDDVGADVDDGDGDGDGDGWVNSFLSHRARYLVQVKLAGAKRDYACPTGTSSCASIGYPDSCCQSGTTCVQIDDTGLGSVGCCPDGESCAGEIACSDGQQGCSSESGGGCCIPGYECASVGCTQSQTATTTVVTQTSTTVSDTTTTAITTSTTTTSSHTSSSTSSTTSTSTTSTTASSSTPTTTGDASAPVRPTSGTSTGSYCPTGFYACSAVYGGGCCQTGRDCQTTSCPTTASTTIISNGATIVVPVTAATAAATTASDASTCASGWSICPSSAGPTAGCCPTGYSCGTASCFLATGSATASVAKELPGNAAVKMDGGRILGMMMIIPTFLGFAFGIALI